MDSNGRATPAACAALRRSSSAVVRNVRFRIARPAFSPRQTRRNLALLPTFSVLIGRALPAVRRQRATEFFPDMRSLTDCGARATVTRGALGPARPVPVNHLDPEPSRLCSRAETRRSTASRAIFGRCAKLTAMAGQKPFRRLARGAGGAEDRAAVLAQHVEPRGEIVGMADGRDNAERCAQKG